MAENRCTQSCGTCPDCACDEPDCQCDLDCHREAVIKNAATGATE